MVSHWPKNRSPTPIPLTMTTLWAALRLGRRMMEVSQNRNEQAPGLTRSEPMVDHQFSDVPLAALYDTFHPPADRADFAFYLPMVMLAGSVLDVGCGTGALLKMARDSGHRGRLCGLDPAHGMLEQARARSDIEWVSGDLASARWNEEFDLVVMTGHAFQVLLGDDELKVSLAAVRRSLKETGRFAFETRNPAAKAWESWTPETSHEVIEGRNSVIRMTHTAETSVRGGYVSFTSTFTSPSWDSARVSRSTLRFLDADTLRVFLVDAGLRIDEQFGEWDGSPLVDTSTEIITLASRN